MEKIMRKLASIREVAEVRPIENADRIEVVIVDGWEVVTKKDQFKPGDKCVYIEIDSIVPPKPVFEFLKERKYRVKTIKLRKQISQGIVLKLEEVGLNPDYPIGKDVTDKLEIIKYDPEAIKEAKLQANEQKNKNTFINWLMRFYWFRRIMKGKKKTWPKWIVKTDETRVQNIPSILKVNAKTLCYVTEKLDGSSASYSYKRIASFLWFKDYIFTVCSRNVWLRRKQVKYTTDKYTFDSNNYWKVAIKYDIHKKIKALPPSVEKEIVIQGEILGNGIQGNKYNIKPNDIEFRVFNIYNIKEDKWLGLAGIMYYCKLLDLNMVPVLWTGRLKNLGTTVNDLLEKSKGKSELNSKIHREGIVIRQISSEKGKRGLSFKATNPDFLLKYQDS
jgi:RNA ligase (TIGR02306 family)